MKKLVLVLGFGVFASAAYYVHAVRVPPAGALKSQTQADFGSVPEFTLTDQSGKKVRRSDLSAPWVAAFIYTRCMDQCPLITQRMVELKPKLPGARFVSFSVDAHDSPADLAGFAEEHHADWTFLTDSKGAVKKLVVDAFKLPVVEGKSADEIIHSGYLVLVDGAGRIRGFYDSDDAAALAKLEKDWAALGARPTS